MPWFLVVLPVAALLLGVLSGVRPSVIRPRPRARVAVGAGGAVLRPVAPLTVIVPAYDEAEHVADTLRSLQAQTLLPERVLVVDDCSTDGTGAVAAALDVEVLRPAVNTGSKAGAQNLALRQVSTALTMAIDADTVLAPDAIERLLPVFDEPRVVAGCGSVIPRHVRSVWERGRYVEYLVTFSFSKRIQDYFGHPMISSGCFSAYRTEQLKDVGGWPTRTLAEDMDLTWTFYERGWGVRFVPDAVSYPVEPHDLGFMSTQLRRWSHGFVQNVRVHWRGTARLPYLRTMITLGLWDGLLASLLYLLVLPVLAVLVDPLFLLAYVVDAPVLLVLVLFAGLERREPLRAVASLPAYFVLRLTNAVFLLRALWSEVVLNRRLDVYEKGH